LIGKSFSKLLYSVGWNQRDDNGNAKGDRVWPVEVSK